MEQRGKGRKDCYIRSTGMPTPLTLGVTTHRIEPRPVRSE